MAALLSGGGTVRVGVATGEGSLDMENVAFLGLLREVDLICSKPRPNADVPLGELMAVDAGEARLAVSPGMMGRSDARLDAGVAAIPSQAKSSIGWTILTISVEPKRAI